MVSSFAVVAASVTSMILFYNIFKNQVYDDLKDDTHIIQALIQEKQKLEENRVLLEKDGLRITLIRKDGSVEYDSSADQQNMENHKDRPEIKAAGKSGQGTAVRRPHRPPHE